VPNNPPAENRTTLCLSYELRGSGFANGLNKLVFIGETKAVGAFVQMIHGDQN
jgi:hypothetical protein